MRDRPRIIYDILRSIMAHEKAEGTVKVTWIQNDANLPTDRLRSHLREMESLGLLEYGDSIRSTPKGREFAAEFERVANVLKRYGLD
jgi:predicted transcriptional regulator